MRRLLCSLITAAALAGCTAAMPARSPSPAGVRRLSSASVTGTTQPPTTGARQRHSRRRATPSTNPRSTNPPSTNTARSRTSSHGPGSPAPTVVLNPGHNGGNASHPAEVNRMVPAGYGQEKACDTTGTDTASGYPEHAFNWDVALRVARILHSHGVRVVLTRHSDHGVGPCVNQRAAIGNHPWVAAVVSIHADGAPASGQGFHVNQDSRVPDGATRRIARESRQLGRDIHATLARSSGLVPSTYIGSDGYYYRDDLAGLNLARRPATFLELGNMKNPHDAALQSSPSGRQRIAAAIAAGILSFLGTG